MKVVGLTEHDLDSPVDDKVTQSLVRQTILVEPVPNQKSLWVMSLLGLCLYDHFKRPTPGTVPTKNNQGSTTNISRSELLVTVQTEVKWLDS